MIGGNPFTQTRFSGTAYSNSPSNYSYSRNYFPLRNQSNNNIKPAFLISSQVSYPTLPSDFRSPYSHFINNQEVKPKRQYISNPFLKSHLFESNPAQNYASRTSTNDPGSNYLYVGVMAQSKVTPIYSNYNDAENLKQKSSREKKSKLKKVSSEQKIGTTNYINQYSPRNNVKQSTIEKLYQGTKETNQQKYYNPEQKTYKDREEPKFGYGESFQKQYNKNQREFEKVDDPLNYNIPSFTIKKKQDPSSPAFHAQDYVARQSAGMQSSKGNMQIIPNTLKYNGKTFYLVPCSEEK